MPALFARKTGTLQALGATGWSWLPVGTSVAQRESDRPGAGASWVCGWSARGLAQPAGPEAARHPGSPAQGTESTQPAPGLPPKSRLEKTLYRGKGENEEKRLFRGVGAGVLTVAASRSAAAGGVARSEQGRDRVFTVSVIALHIFAANTFVVNIFTALLTGQP